MNFCCVCEQPFTNRTSLGNNVIFPMHYKPDKCPFTLNELLVKYDIPFNEHRARLCVVCFTEIKQLYEYNYKTKTGRMQLHRWKKARTCCKITTPPLCLWLVNFSKFETAARSFKLQENEEVILGFDECEL